MELGNLDSVCLKADLGMFSWHIHCCADLGSSFCHNFLNFLEDTSLLIEGAALKEEFYPKFKLKL